MASLTRSLVTSVFLASFGACGVTGPSRAEMCESAKTAAHDRWVAAIAFMDERDAQDAESTLQKKARLQELKRGIGVLSGEFATLTDELRGREAMEPGIRQRNLDLRRARDSALGDPTTAHDAARDSAKVLFPAPIRAAYVASERSYALCAPDLAADKAACTVARMDALEAWDEITQELTPKRAEARAAKEKDKSVDALANMLEVAEDVTRDLLARESVAPVYVALQSFQKKEPASTATTAQFDPAMAALKRAAEACPTTGR